LLATNPTVVAMANLGGLVGLSLVLWAVGRRILAFAKSLHENTIRGALKAMSFRRKRHAKWLSLDVHLFLISLAFRAVAITMSVMVILAGLISKTRNRSDGLIHISEEYRHVFAIIFERIYPSVAMIIITIVFFDTLVVMQYIRRYRMRDIRAYNFVQRALALEAD
jgi:hypothetical protein